MQEHLEEQSMTAEVSVQEKSEYIRRRCIEANPDITKRHYTEECIKKFGYPIHLADVLNALQRQYQYYIPDTTISTLCQGYWNLLTDDLGEQSDDKIEYIYKLLQGTL
jgi:hypothetical protein